MFDYIHLQDTDEGWSLAFSRTCKTRFACCPISCSFHMYALPAMINFCSSMPHAEATVVEDNGEVLLAGCDRYFIGSPAILQFADSLYPGGLNAPLSDEDIGSYGRRLSQAIDCNTFKVNVSAVYPEIGTKTLSIVQLAKSSERGGGRGGQVGC